MLLEIHRCKHCGKQYNYHASGAGCGDECNSPEYCPDCMAAISSALKAIRVGYAKRYGEIPFDRGLVEKFEEFKKKDENEARLFPKCMCGTPEMAAIDYEHIDVYNYKFEEYAVAYDDPGDKHLFMLQEYDLANHQFTGRPWSGGKAGMSYTRGWNFLKSYAKAAECINPDGAVGKPVGKVFYNGEII